jgi:leukotriene A-4 hydrolase/aminopeptidase
MKQILLTSAILTSSLFSANACRLGGNSGNDVAKAVAAGDSHSYANTDKVYCTNLFLDIQVSFDKKQIEGVATWDIKNPGGADKIIFDTKSLNIKKVIVDNKHEANFTFGKKDDLLGSSLEVPITKKTKKISIYYNTTEGSEALQWLNPMQTGGKKYPYLFTQGEAILTRTWIPCQDSPAKRITYSARVKVPKELMAVMSATNPVKKNETGVYTFQMKQPVPTYLIALAVGDLEYRVIGKRTGIYTEPKMIDKAAYEFADMEKMLIAAEKLYGKYQWGKYDVIVLPPSFPFGGMENPKLTFATPTLIAGDRSLTSVIAHEMAHSWSGNLVTNATWNDFWLNEGFTVYFERRIMEELYGSDYTNMLALLGYQDLVSEVEDLSPEDTKLKLNLCNRNPDDGMSEIAYEKGAFFLRMLEDAAGRENFDKFLRGYFEKFEFQTMTTEKFLEYLDAQLIKKYSLSVNVNDWVYKQGIPSNIPKIESDRFVKVEAKIEEWKKGTAAASLGIKEWSTHEWLHFLRNLPRELSHDKMHELDNAFAFTNSGNAEILTEWFKLCINNKYSHSYTKLEEFLINVGRRKFLKPLYSEMVKTPEGKELAKKIYAKARENYHSISFNTVDAMLGWKE